MVNFMHYLGAYFEKISKKLPDLAEESRVAETNRRAKEKKWVCEAQKTDLSVPVENKVSEGK